MSRAPTICVRRSEMDRYIHFFICFILLSSQFWATTSMAGEEHDWITEGVKAALTDGRPAVRLEALRFLDDDRHAVYRATADDPDTANAVFGSLFGPSDAAPDAALIDQLTLAPRFASMHQATLVAWARDDSQSLDHRFAALRALGRIHEPTPGTRQAIIELFGTDHIGDSAKSAAVEMFKRGKLQEELREALANPERRLRALEVIGAQTSAAVVEPLRGAVVAALSADDPEVVTKAVEALLRFSEPALPRELLDAFIKLPADQRDADLWSALLSQACDRASRTADLHQLLAMSLARSEVRSNAERCLLRHPELIDGLLQVVKDNRSGSAEWVVLLLASSSESAHSTARESVRDATISTALGSALEGAPPSTLARLSRHLIPLLRHDEPSAWNAAQNLQEAGVKLSAEDLGIVAGYLAGPPRQEAALAMLRQAGPDARQYASDIAALVHQPEYGREAILALAGIGAGATLESEIPQLLEHGDPDVRDAVFTLIASDAALLKRHGDRVYHHVGRQDDVQGAVRALAALEERNARYVSGIIQQIRGRQIEFRTPGVTEALLRHGPASASDVVDLLELALSESKPEEAATYRFYAILLADDDGREMTRWLGGAAPRPEVLDDAALALLTRFWQHVGKDDVEIGAELADIVNDLAAGIHGLDVIDALRTHSKILKERALKRSEIDQALLYARIAVWVERLAGAIGLHLALWIVLLLLYPKFEFIQALFWHAPVRAFLGLFYIGPLLVRLGPVRRRLLTPFRYALSDSLLSEKNETETEETTYFTGSRVSKVAHEAPLMRAATDDEHMLLLVDAISDLSGQFVLVGASGLGKTMFVHRIIRKARRPTAFLRAQDCKQDVTGALVARLAASIADRAFFESLLEAGGLDVVIDGLNEVDADSRQAITLFAKQHPHLNLLLTTQPIAGWQPPRSATVFRLQPLSSSEVRAFLLSRPVGRGNKDYEMLCERFLAMLTGEDLPEPVRGNPMDLTVVADMLADGYTPDVAHLQEQQYELMASRYNSLYGGAFPLQRMSQVAYDMRRSNQSALDPGKVGKQELDVMREQRLVLLRHTSLKEEFHFRHDKIHEFFIERHIEDWPLEKLAEIWFDSRFFGALLLLVAHVPYERAQQLKDAIVEAAAERADHSLSDRVVEIVRRRRLAGEDGQPWIHAYDLPKLAELEEQVKRRRDAQREANTVLEATLAELEAHRSLYRLLDGARIQMVRGAAAYALSLTDRDRVTSEGENIWLRDARGRRWQVHVIVRAVPLDVADVPVFSRNEIDYHLLIVNTTPDVAPRDREPYATDAAIRAGKEKGMVLISAPELFAMVGAGASLSQRLSGELVTSTEPREKEPSPTEEGEPT